MIHKILRLVLLGLAAGLLLGGMAGCFGGGDDEPTPDIQKTIKAEVEARQTPTSEPTEPPTPDAAATTEAILKAIAGNQPTAAPPAATPEPPTAVPAPTEPPTAAPAPTTAAPEPTEPPTAAPTTPSDEPPGGPPCIIVGTLTIGGADAPVGTKVSARIATGTVKEIQTTDAGRYSLSLTNFGETFDLYVNDTDSGENTPECTQGTRNLKNLSIN